VQALEVRVLSELEPIIAAAPDAVTTLRTAAMAWIDLAGDPVIQQILLIDGPSVMGWEQWQAMGATNALDATRAILHGVAEEGRLPAEFVDPFARMLLAALDEIALTVARADDPAAAMAVGRAAVAELLRRITTP
jgi:hypothetical protein